MPYGKRDGVAYKEVLVLKAPLLTCLTCPLCDYLLREATTISECLHTFCSECITAELSHGESESCPVCQVSLGTLPLEKLRADHQLNDLKEKLFPSNAKKRKPDVLVGSPRTSNVNATRRKERSLYSLGVKGPPAVNPGYASRKTRALPGTHGSSGPSSMDEELEDEGDDDDDDEEDISHDSPTTILKLSSHNNGGSRRASPDDGPDAKVYPHSEPRRRPEGSAVTPRADGELVRAGSNSRPWTTSKLSQRLPQTVSNGYNNASGSVPPGPRDISKYVRGSRKSNGVGIRAPAARVGEFPSALDALAQVADADAAMEETNSRPSSVSPPDFRTPGSKTVAGHTNSKEMVLAIAGSSQLAGQTDIPAATTNGPSLQSRLKQTLSGVMFKPSIIRNPRPILGPRAGAQSLRSSSNGIWFHLEAGDVQANEDALPPLSSPFVRIKDVKLPVYHVKTYLVLKLAHKVTSEMEVEITCRGQPVVSSLPLESIRDIWFSAQISDEPQSQAQGQAQPQGESSTALVNGSSNAQAEFPTSKDFLMVLTYRRHRKPRFN